METVTPEQKQPVMKTLALGGLVALIILVAWLAVQIVQVMPSALSSLANIAGSVYNYNPLKDTELDLKTSDVLVNSGQPFSLSWSPLPTNGTYTFSFTCQDQITLNLTSNDKDFNDLECGKEYELGDVNSIDLLVTTKKERFTDVSYTLSFYRTNDSEAAASKTATTSIVNDSITVENQNDTVTVATTTATTTVAAATSTESVATTTKPTPEQTATTTKPAPKPVAEKPVVTIPTYTYGIPKSNPNGKTDLAITSISVGTVGSTGIFTKRDSLRVNADHALQLYVHNLGDRTSETWTYEVELPDGSTYRSQKEEPLKPNERAIITIRFEAQSEVGYVLFSAELETSRDANSINNRLLNGALVTR